MEPLLTVDEERALFKRWRRGDARAADRLVTSNQGIVWKLAQKYQAWAPLADLMQEGNVGLMHALERFDPARGIRWMSYASWWVRAYMREYARRQPSIVRVPSRLHKRFRPFAEHDTPLDAPAFAGDKRNRVDGLASDQESIEAQLVALAGTEQARAQVRSALVGLDRRSRDIVTLRYLAEDPWTLQRIAFKYHLSRERVRQLEARALQKLKRRLAA